MIESENRQISEEEMNISLPIEPQDDHESPKEDEKVPTKEKESHNKQFEDFLNTLANQTTPEAKLILAIEMMKSSISQGGSPNFKNFWEARKQCLPLFKENIIPSLRSDLWTQYIELSKEARRLKEILDEQSAFAVEQIEMAIGALEKEIIQLREHIIPADGLAIPKSFDLEQAFYRNVQGELQMLNAQASRINALRKELIKTEMRVRQKNQFFQRLSTAGDSVFPRRKELIKDISTHFTKNVEDFIKEFFSDDISHDLLFFLREEIKVLQSLAKDLTLNTISFTKTRQRLSECWDKLKVEEKEFKKERAQQRAAFKQNAEEIQEKLKQFSETFASGQLSTHDAHTILDELSTTMRSVQLGRDEVKALRDEMGALRKTIQEKMKGEEDVRYQQDQEREKQKKEKVKDLRNRIQELMRNHDSYDVERLSSERDSLLAETQQASISKVERQELERILKPLRDIITEKKERTLLSLSEDDRSSLLQLKAILKQRIDRRQEIKNQLETLRKFSGNSGFDFEKAMNYQLQIDEEKERLEKANHGIKEIQDKIASLGEK